jgi:maltooligosyltrehalose trehalohydrolase
MKRAHKMPFGAYFTEAGVRFSLWGPSAREVELLLDGNPPRPLQRDNAGWWSIETAGAPAGAHYSYRINGELIVPDPASRYQPGGPFAPSVVVDPHAYEWQDEQWNGRPWREIVVYETHVGTATSLGTFAALAERLQEIGDLGINAIELMPLADCPGERNWGYDGVLPFSPHHAYGAPDDLKRFIDAAHALGIAVLIDVVYNHFGPSGNVLPAYADCFFTQRHSTPWGAGINFDGINSKTIRSFFLHNALYWLEEYHADGLRFDAVHAIADDSTPHFIETLATDIRHACPDRYVHLVLENEKNESRWLIRNDKRKPQLYTAQWDDDVHHCWHVLLTGESEGYYADYYDEPVAKLARGLSEGFVYQGEISPHAGTARGEDSTLLPPLAFVSFLQNHDQVGNRAFGERLSALVKPAELALAHAILILSPQIPMLFMGEEWNASTPFLYFVDFPDDPDLSRIVREGRSREFFRFSAFANTGTVPDPTDKTTAERSRLLWGEVATGHHATARSKMRTLIRLRRKEVVPLIAGRFLGSTYHCPSPFVMDITWAFANGTQRLIANFGPETTNVVLEEETRPFWMSDGATLKDRVLTVPSWQAAMLKDSQIVSTR